MYDRNFPNIWKIGKIVGKKSLNFSLKMANIFYSVLVQNGPLWIAIRSSNHKSIRSDLPPWFLKAFSHSY